MTVAVIAQESTSGNATVPTFAELKAIGAQRSSYQKRWSANATDGKRSEAPSADLEGFRKRVLPVLSDSCVPCHGADTQEGNIRIDSLDPNLFLGDDVNWWLEVLAVIANGEMPPADEGELTEQDRATLIEWLSTEIQNASIARRAEKGHSSFRRMTRYEYNYALQDLLRLPFDFAKDLPPEATSEDGFQNSSEMLHMSAMQFDTYRTSARNAMRRATVRGSLPEPIYWCVSMSEAAKKAWEKQDEEEQKIRERHKDDEEKLEQELKRHAERKLKPPRNTYYKDLTTNRVARAAWSYGGAQYSFAPTAELAEMPTDYDHIAVIPSRQRLVIELGDRIPEEGMLRVRVRAARVSMDEPARIPSLRLEFGWQASNDSAAAVTISERDTPIAAEPGNSQIYEWMVPLGEVYPRNTVRNISKMGDLPSPSEFLRLVNSSVATGDILIEYVEVSAPIYEHWPPRSHELIFPANRPAAKNSNDEDTSEREYVRTVLAQFMSRAWRRPASASELEQKLALYRKVRPACDNHEEAIVEVLSTVLASPKFLYLRSPSWASSDESMATPGRLATRLSMFLWCSIPDQQLQQLDRDGKLSNPSVLTEQVRRMLADEKSRRFTKQFVRQWLGMALLDYLDVDRKVYPHFDGTLREAMQQEPLETFHELLLANDSALDLLHTEYAHVNERLAVHYGIPDVFGNHFRRVAVEPQHRRGGLLTQAGLLAMNSDGKDSHPLKRGIWLLESVLNDPPPPPPPAVPEIDIADPEIAKLTLKERIEDHRDDPACLSCHAKIDPWGIAFENFDAVGTWRTEAAGKPVDATSQLFNGQVLDGVGGLKRFLLRSRQDQFIRALVYKLSTYALGRPLSFSDHASIDQITAKVRQEGDGLATIVTQIVLSDLFRSQ